MYSCSLSISFSAKRVNSPIQKSDTTKRCAKKVSCVPSPKKKSYGVKNAKRLCKQRAQKDVLHARVVAAENKLPIFDYLCRL